jgi:hypothetical protein
MTRIYSRHTRVCRQQSCSDLVLIVLCTHTYTVMYWAA